MDSSYRINLQKPGYVLLCLLCLFLLAILFVSLSKCQNRANTHVDRNKKVRESTNKAASLPFLFLSSWFLALFWHLLCVRSFSFEEGESEEEGEGARGDASTGAQQTTTKTLHPWGKTWGSEGDYQRGSLPSVLTSLPMDLRSLLSSAVVISLSLSLPPLSSLSPSLSLTSLRQIPKKS